MKTLHDEYFGCSPLCLIFSFAVIMSEINPTDHKSTTARHFQRDNKRVESLKGFENIRQKMYYIEAFCWID